MNIVDLNKTYVFHKDPGHGWLEVPLSELIALGIEKTISGYSYIYKSFVYLEEDCDAERFISALPFRPKIETVYYKDDAPIRNFVHYTGGK